MFVIRAFLNGLIIVSVFSSGFYLRHKLEPIFETVERLEQGKAKAASAASTLWPF